MGVGCGPGCGCVPCASEYRPASYYTGPDHLYPADYGDPSFQGYIMRDDFAPEPSTMERSRVSRYSSSRGKSQQLRYAGQPRLSRYPTTDYVMSGGMGATREQLGRQYITLATIAAGAIVWAIWNQVK